MFIIRGDQLYLQHCNKFMSRYSIFHQVKALVVFLVFGFSLLPRQVVHDFVTNHQHVRYAAAHGEHVLSPDTINCNSDNIFLQQTYTPTGGFALKVPVIFYGAPGDCMPTILLPIDAHPAATRGPPALA